MTTINLVQYGAPDDGSLPVTDRVRHAIQELAGNGGGELLFPKGLYRCGHIELMDNITLNLSEGAVLQLIPDISEMYHDLSVPPEAWLPYYFIHANHCKNITICGKGTIDGCGRFFWEDTYMISGKKENEMDETRSVAFYDVLKPKPERPVLSYFSSCTNLKITEVTLTNSPAYTIWVNDCEDVLIDNIIIRNPRKSPNTDGLDIDCSERVKILHCNILAGDDCVAIKSDPYRTGTSRPCQEIEVAFCTFSSTTCAIRVGYEGNNPIQNCHFHDLEFKYCQHGINILTVAPNCKAIPIHGTPIDHLVFENIIMNDVAQGLYVWAGREDPSYPFTGHLRDVTFKNISISSIASSYIGGESPQVISGLKFIHVHLKVADNSAIAETVNPNMSVPSLWSGHFKVGGIFFQGTNADIWDHSTVSCTQPGQPSIRKCHHNQSAKLLAWTLP